MAEETPKRKGRMPGGRANGEGSFRQRADGSWECRIRLGGKYRSFYGSTKSAAGKAKDDAKKEMEAGRDLNRRREKVGAYLTRWLEDTAAIRVSPRTLVEYRSIVVNHLQPALGAIWLHELSPSDVQTMLNAVHRAGLSPRRVSHLRAVLRTALSDAMKVGAVSRNVAKLVTLPTIDRERVVPLDPAQARALIAATDGTIHGAVFTVALTCGLRQGEVLGLRWQDIDFAAGTLSVRQSLKSLPGKVEMGAPKSRNSRRTIPLPTAAADVLRRQRDRQTFDRHAAGGAWEDGDLVFANATGGPLSAWAVRMALKRALEDAGLPPVTFHALRHGCASLLLSSSVPLAMVSRILGHSTVALTADVYGHIGVEAMRVAATAMDAAMTGTDGGS